MEELIFSVGGEGGSVKLIGRRRPEGAGWEYRRSLNEMSYDPDEEDTEPSAPRPAPVVKPLVWVDTWADALALMDRNPWVMLHPLAVHPEFREEVLVEATRRLVTQSSSHAGRAMAKWLAICKTPTVGGAAEARPVVPLGRVEPPAPNDDSKPVQEVRTEVPADHRLAPLIARALEHPEFAARWSDASDKSFRPLVAFAFERHLQAGPQDSVLEPLIEALCYRKRVELLEERVGKGTAPRFLAWLPRVEWLAMTLADWDALGLIASREPATSPLGHVERITPMLIRQYGRIPEAFRVPAVLNVVGGLVVPSERWERLRQALAEADADPFAGAQIRATLVAAAEEVDSIGGFWDFYFRAEGAHDRPFEIPQAFKGSALLEPIATPLALEFEATRMGNCLFNRASTVRNGSRVYFNLKDGSPIDAELVRQGEGWVPGDILGAKNAAVAEAIAAPLRAELQRMARCAPPIGEASIRVQQHYIDELRDLARRTFPAAEVGQITGSLKQIQERSPSWADGAYVIVQMAEAPFVQFMASPDGTEFLFEIGSHKYQKAVDGRLTAEVVELIERCGFQWPTRKANFARWFTVASAEDLQGLAELGVTVLMRAFGYAAGEKLEITVHIPE